MNTTLNQADEKNEYALLQFKRDYLSENDKEGTRKFQKIVAILGYAKNKL